jgi:ATP-dependent helicase/nuclease subunit B
MFVDVSITEGNRSMAARFTVVVGPARSGKTEHLLGLYRAALAGRPAIDALESVLWLAPSQRAAEDVRRRLPTAELPACFAPGILTFAQLADRVLDHAAEEIRPIDARMQRLLIEQLLSEAKEAGRLKHFGPIAETPGLVDLAVEFVRELKRNEIWPDDFARACTNNGRRLDPKNRELHELYNGYQNLLVKQRLYDGEGRLWSARDRLQRGQSRPFERLRLVVVDGFTDLTRTQHEIVDALAERVEAVYVGLVDGGDEQRSELFSKPRGTLERLRIAHPKLHVERLTAPHNRPTPGLRHLESELFKNPRHVKRGPDARGVEILAASGRVSEIEELARRIKRLLVEGDARRSYRKDGTVRPDDVAVVFRTLDDAAPLVREVFARYGIPTAIEAGRRLDQSPSLTSLLGLLQLNDEDWPFRQLLAVTGSNFFHPAWPEAHRPGVAEAVEATIRAFAVPEGREELLKQVEKAATAPQRVYDKSDPHADQVERFNLRRDQAILAWPVLRKLGEAFDRLPTSATSREWSDALTKLARDTGLWRSLHEADELPAHGAAALDVHADRAAWARFHDALQTADLLSVLVERDAPRLNRRDLLDTVRDIIRTEQLPGDHDEAGRVRVLSVVTARNLTFPYLFLAGLTEKAFPAGVGEGRLHGEGEYQQFVQSGLRLNSVAERFRDEMLLFYEAVTRSDAQLLMSYAALNDKAEPLLPSPYLRELTDLFEKEVLKTETMTDLSAVPSDDAVTSPAERRVRAVAKARHGDPSELAAVLRDRDDAVANLAQGLKVVQSRGHKDGFGPYEGILAADPVLKKLLRRYDDEFPWSADQLERYGQCPHQFFLERVLRLRVPDDVGLEIDRRRRGIRLHDVLAHLHAKINNQLGKAAAPSEVTPRQLQAWTDELVADIVGRDEHPQAEALAEIDRRLLRKWLGQYADQHLKYDATYETCAQPAKPQQFEVSFGLPTRGSDTRSTSKPLELAQGDEKIRITGRIDRIDVGMNDGQPIFSVVDYKTGSGNHYNKDAVLAGRALQLTLYAIAVERLNLATPGAVPWQFGYWFIGAKGFKKTLALHEAVAGGVQPTQDWIVLQEQVVERVLSLVRGVRRGEFPMFNRDEDCTSRCDFRTVCRVAQTRWLEKSWLPPAPSPT